MNDDIKVVKDVSGQAYRAIEIKQEHLEDFVLLAQHPGWKVYRRFLEANRDNSLLGLMVQDPQKGEGNVFKRIGKAEGLNLAATSLDLLILQLKEKAKRVEAESTKPPQL